MKKILALLFLILSLLAPQVVHADGPLFSTSLGFEFASGKYGTATRTDSLYVPLIASIQPTGRLGFSLEVPYLYQSSSAVNTGVISGARGHGMATVQHDPGMSGSMSGGSMTSNSGGDAGAAQSGLGDIIAKGGYVLVPETDLMPSVRPYFMVKFPTAASDKTLGTGAFAEGIAVELSKKLGDWYSFAEAGYVWQGSSRTVAVRNYLSYDAGLGRAFADRFLPMLVVKGSTAPIAGSTDLLELRLKLRFLATAKTGIEGYIGKGFTTNSPDYGSGIAVFHDF